MAFAGTLSELAVGGGLNILEISGLTLAANAGAFDITAADSGRLTSDNTTTPANETAISPTWGPGEGAWTQTDVDAVTVIVQGDTGLNTANAVLVTKSLVGGPPGNINVDIHNLGAGAANATVYRLKYEHSLAR